jgi:carboxymethylenebutenolidase
MTSIASESATIDTREGPMRAIVVRPPGQGPFPAVMTYPHIGGLTNTMRLMAARVAEGGYVSVVIDLYHRLGTIVIDPESTQENVVAISRIAAASVTDAGAMQDTAAAFDWFDAQPFIRGPSVGTIGYGRGGSLAVRAAAEFPDRVHAAASVLGFGFTKDGVPECRSRLARIRGGLYCAFAEHDDIISHTVQDELSSSLDGLTLDAQLVVHPGARHPYVFPDRAVHDAAAAARDWEAIFAMYARHLGSTAQGGAS